VEFCLITFILNKQWFQLNCLSGGLKMKVKAKRSYCNYLLPYKSSPSCRSKTAVITKENLHPEKMEEKQADDIENNDNIYIFQPGMVPPSRQMFYQVLYI
jgi:hypothetical protein